MSSLQSQKQPEAALDLEPPALASDATLLTQFLTLKNEAAFAALVHRYGHLVFGVAFRIVRDRHTAEDVVQATFLTFARDARKIRRRECLSSWLHGVAIRLSRKAMKRRSREKVNDVVTELAAAQESFEEIHSTFEQQVLDEELARLPAQYRDPLILHFLEGKTYEETAQQLGVTVGAIEGRMKRGKRELQLRLTRRGVGLSTTLAALCWSQGEAVAAMQPELIHVIAQNGTAAFQGTAFTPTCSPEAVYLAGKEVTMLTTTKIAAVACSLALAAGAGWLSHAGFAQDANASGGEDSGSNVKTTVVQKDQPPANSSKPTVTQTTPAFGQGTEQFAPAGDVFDSSTSLETETEDPFGTKGEPKSTIPVSPLEMSSRLVADTPGNPEAIAVPLEKISVERNQSPAEQKIQTALETIVSFEFPGNPLSDIVDFLSEQHDIPILIDDRALSDEGLTPDDEMKLQIGNVTLQSALDLTLEQMDLTYIIRHETLMITTLTRAQEITETRVYDVRPLEIQLPEALADVLLHTIDPESWSELGGPGDISFLNGSLVVRQTQKLHAEIETLLNQLARQIQGNDQNPAEWPTLSRPPKPVSNGGFGMGSGGLGSGF